MTLFIDPNERVAYQLLPGGRRSHEFVTLDGREELVKLVAERLGLEITPDFHHPYRATQPALFE